MTTYSHIKTAAHYAMSAKQCQCGSVAGEHFRCLHRCLLHTVFMEKVLESYERARAGLRESRDVETQTCRGDYGGDDSVTSRVAVDGRQGEEGEKPAAGSERSVKGCGVSAAEKPCDDNVASGCGWNPFRWLRPKGNAVAKLTIPAAVKKVKTPSRVKYIQVRSRPKKKKTTMTTTAIETDGPLSSTPVCDRDEATVGPSSSSEAVPPQQPPPPSEPLDTQDVCAGRGPIANDRDGGGVLLVKVNSGADYGWNPLRWLYPETVSDLTEPSENVHDKPELRQTRRSEKKTNTDAESLPPATVASSSSSP